MTETVAVHIQSVADHIHLGPGQGLATGVSRKEYGVSTSMRTFMVGATSDNSPIPILSQVNCKRRTLLFTNSVKVVITSEPGEASAAVGTGGGTGVVLPNTTQTGSPVELCSTSDVWAVSTDGTPQSIGVIQEFWSE